MIRRTLLHVLVVGHVVALGEGLAHGQPADPPPAPPPATVGDVVGGEGPVPAPAPPPPAPPSAPEGTEPEPHELRGPGASLRYVLEGLEVRGNTTTRARVVLRYVRFHPGDVLDVNDGELERTRFRLLGTGFFRDVQLSLRRGSRRGAAILVIEVAERNTIVVRDLFLGLSADAEPSGRARPLTAYGGLDMAETNLAGTGVTLGGAIAVAERQLALRTRFADPQFLGLPWTAETQLYYLRARDFFGNRDVLVDDPAEKTARDYAVVNYRRFGGTVGAGRDVGPSTQIFFHYRLESLEATLPRAASHRRGLDIEPIDFQIARGNSVLSSVRASLVHDTRDEPFLPSRGVHVVAASDASLTPLGSDYPFVKLRAHASQWFPLSWGHVLRVEAFAGAILGEAPLFEKFYVGDLSDLLPDRVLELNVDRRPAPNFLGTSIVETRYGEYAARLTTEYRVPLYRGRRSIYGADLFAAAGVYGLATEADLRQRPRGYRGFAAVPIDLTFNLGLRVDTSAGGFTFGLSNILGFLPVRGEGL